MEIIIGSKAANSHIKTFRHGNDLDIWTSETLPQKKGIDSVVMSQNILDAFETASKETGIATLNDLLTIKLSHLPYDIFWHKHRNDYLVFKKHGGRINEPLYNLLKAHWKDVHNNKPYLSLYRTKDSFFDDFVKKEFDHDYLHELVAYPNEPVYKSCLKDGQEVAIDHNKFLSLHFDQQVKMFREEVNVIMCERWLIPTREKGTILFNDAYSRSVHKTVTALTKGWASYFMCENIELFIRPNYEEVKWIFKQTGINV